MPMPCRAATARRGRHLTVDLEQLFTEQGRPEYGTIASVTAAEALDRVGVEKLTRDHVAAINDLASHRWFGRCAILHDAAGSPTEIYFWATPETERPGATPVA